MGAPQFTEKLNSGIGAALDEEGTSEGPLLARGD